MSKVRKFGAGGIPTGSFAPPPAAKPAGPVPGQTLPVAPMASQQRQGLPLRPGKPIRVQHAAPHEKAALAPYGFEEGDYVPDNMAEVLGEARMRELAQVQGEMQADITDTSKMPPPIDPSTPPLKIPEPVPIEQLPAHKAAEIRKLLAEATAQAENAQQQAAVMPSTPGPGVAEAITGESTLELEMDDEPGEQPAIPPSLSGAAPKLTHCPHCSWDLAVQDTIKVTDADKNMYRAAFLGQIPFQKTYSRFDGELSVTVRELSLAEVDTIYKQCYFHRLRGEIVTNNDFQEWAMRYRLCLQLVEVRTPDSLNQFPKSLSDWNVPPLPPEATEEQKQATPLVQVYQELRAFLHNESFHRVLSRIGLEFDRLTAKLEENSQTEGFWQRTSPEH